MTQDASILLIAQPGKLRESLQVLLAAISGNRPVLLASNWPVETISAREKPLVLVMLVLERGSLGTQATTLVTEIKSRLPQARLVVLVDTEQQQHAATFAGADRVWFKGALAAQMLVEIEMLINE